jgi:O6-methylguanine-DNA--protein-cysteine methyltransferase
MHSGELNIYLASSDKGALMVKIGLKQGQDCLTHFKKIFPSDRVVKDERRNRSLIGAVEAVLKNGPAWRDLPLDIICTPFQLTAWKAIARIPFGETKTYGEVARMIGRPGGARAVGQAMGRNPLPLIFP